MMLGESIIAMVEEVGDSLLLKNNNVRCKTERSAAGQDRQLLCE
jgi:hypothetical protein